MKQNKPKNFWLVVRRGVFGYCPNCGGGKLFTSYLKQVEQCIKCSERFGHINADDGPSWLTILLVGHILAPFLLGVLPNTTWPDWIVTSVIASLMLVLTLLILPRAKGVFISLIWRSWCCGAEK